LPEVPFLQEQALRPDIPQGAGGCIRKEVACSNRERKGRCRMLMAVES
jgi:hypothetical protein